MLHKENILIIDFGSQYTQLIARRIREFKVYSEIHPHTYSIEKIKEMNPSGIIFSGGPMSIYEDDSPQIDPKVFDLGIPILGICYGLQVVSKQYNGKIEAAQHREYGKTILNVVKDDILFNGINKNSQVWMSHGDYITQIPEGFNITAKSDNSPICAISNPARKIFALQFHPEVAHTIEGKKILNNFLFNICNCKGEWTPKSFIQNSIEEIKIKIGNKKAICALSGGVDSSVAAILVQKAIGENLVCIHVDTGMMRKNESRDIVKMFEDNYKIHLIHIDATEIFLSRLAGVSEPEKKRKIIGNTFIEIFEEEAKRLAILNILFRALSIRMLLNLFLLKELRLLLKRIIM